MLWDQLGTKICANVLALVTKFTLKNSYFKLWRGWSCSRFIPWTFFVLSYLYITTSFVFWSHDLNAPKPLKQLYPSTLSEMTPSRSKEKRGADNPLQLTENCLYMNSFSSFTWRSYERTSFLLFKISSWQLLDKRTRRWKLVNLWHCKGNFVQKN